MLPLFILTPLIFLPSTAAPPPLLTATIHHLPSTPSLSSSPTPLATLTFSLPHPHLSRLKNFTPPKINKKDADSLVQIGICFSDSECRTTASMVKSLHPPYTGRLRVVVDQEGKVLGVSWRAWLADGGTDKAKVDDERRYEEGVGSGDFDIVVQKSAPGIWVDQPGAKGKGRGKQGSAAKTESEDTGEEEGEKDEKTFLQK
ncbi:MAG: hypothetical protein Q9220_007346 [cf. Caloplaca sp. 1 TL-2023]